MANKKRTGLAATLADRFTDVWKLLSETTTFLSMIPEFDQYESQLRSWRATLQRSITAYDTQKIRGEIVALRKTLRLLGYDLSLGGQTITIEGFRNDTSSAEGFRRVVLFIMKNAIVWLSGDENHLILSDFLESRVLRNIPNLERKIIGKHYLWYRRRGNNLVLSGSDTEAKDDFERLKAMADANTLFFLAELKNLK